MSNIIRRGRKFDNYSGPVNLNSSEVTQNDAFCKLHYGSEWASNGNRTQYGLISRVYGECIHNTFSGNNNTCCSAILDNNFIFGSDAVQRARVHIDNTSPSNLNTGPRITCKATDNTLNTCITSDFPNNCINELKTDRATNNFVNPNCGKYLRMPGNNLNIYDPDLVAKLQADYNTTTQQFNKFNLFFAAYTDLSIIQDLRETAVKRSEVFFLRREYASLLTTNTTLLANIRNKEGELNNLTGRISTLEDTQRNLLNAQITQQSIISNLQGTITSLTSQILNFTNEREILRGQVTETWRATTAQIAIIQANHTSTLTSLAAEEARRRKEMEDAFKIQLEQDAQALNALFRLREAELETSLDSLRAELAEKQKEFEDSKASFELQMENLRASRQSEIDILGARITSLNIDLQNSQREKDDRIRLIQQETLEQINQIRINEEIAQQEIIREFESRKQIEMETITNRFKNRELQMEETLMKIKNEMIKAEENYQLSLDRLREKNKADAIIYEEKLMTELANKDRKYLELANLREAQYMADLKQLQELNELKQKEAKLKHDIEIEKIVRERDNIAKQLEDFQKQTQINLMIIQAQIASERASARAREAELKNLIRQKEDEARQAILDIQIALANDLNRAREENEQAKNMIYNETQNAITKQLEKYKIDKEILEINHEEAIRKEQEILDNILKSQEDDYIRRINNLKNSNNKIISELNVLGNIYEETLKDKKLALDNLISTKKSEFILIQEEYKQLAELQKQKFQQIIKDEEAKRDLRILELETETTTEINRLKSILDDEVIRNKNARIENQRKLVMELDEMDKQRMRLIRDKNKETEMALKTLQTDYEIKVKEVDDKILEYNTKKMEYNRRIQDELNLFKNTMKSLEQESQDAITKHNNKMSQLNQYNMEQIDKQIRINQETKEQYLRDLDIMIEEMNENKMRLINEKNDETARLLNVIMDNYENEKNKTNDAIQIFEETQANYFKKVAIIDQEQADFIKRKSIEAEEQLNQISQVLNNEIIKIKDKIDNYKEEKKQIEDELIILNKKMAEIRLGYNQEKITIKNQKYIIYGSMGLIIVLLIAVIYLFFRTQNDFKENDEFDE